MDKLALPSLPVQAGDILLARDAIEMIPEVDLGPPIEVPPIPADANPVNISEEERQLLHKEIRRLKKAKNALVLAHNYEPPDVQDAADFVGDSLHLAKIGRDSNADILIEASVLFMNQILAVMKRPHQTVLAPSLKALCSLAAHADVNKVRAWKDAHPDGKVISYVNTYLDIKAESDICCASGNAAKVIQYMVEQHPASPLLFLPDVFLGYYAAKTLQKLGQSIDRLYLMMGACHVHEKITAHQVMRQRMLHPDAAVVAHMECGCVSKCMTLLDQGLVTEEMMQLRSTWGMIEFLKKAPQKKIIVATTVTNIYPMSIAAPDKEFIPA
ncbi:MAG: quinolinate synthase NadA, partial [Clostridiales bacterium]|nr:quinolinate synthase NadA [Clostridiales bacterium]